MACRGADPDAADPALRLPPPGEAQLSPLSNKHHHAGGGDAGGQGGGGLPALAAFGALLFSTRGTGEDRHRPGDGRVFQPPPSNRGPAVQGPPGPGVPGAASGGAHRQAAGFGLRDAGVIGGRVHASLCGRQLAHPVGLRPHPGSVFPANLVSSQGLPETKDSHLSQSRQGPPGVRLPYHPIHDCSGLRAVLGQRFSQGHPEPAAFSAGAAHGLRVFGVCRGMGVYGLRAAADPFYRPNLVGLAGGPGLQRPVRASTGPGSGGPDFLAGIHQSVHGHRLYAGSWHPFAPVQLRRIISHHHSPGSGIPVEYSHAAVHAGRVRGEDKREKGGKKSGSFR